VNKKALSERDICTKFIHPAIARAGWDLHLQVREEFYITDGRIVVRGRMTKRMKGKFADYVLYYKPNIPIAIVEAKDNNHRVGDGMQQALEYAAMLDIPFAFASNGDAFLAHDRTGQSAQTEREIPPSRVPITARALAALLRLQGAYARGRGGGDSGLLLGR
jgi:type I restriction enzyme R subunit